MPEYEPEDIFDHEEVEEIIINSSFKDTKAECVYKELISMSSGFKDAMNKFGGKNPSGGHLKFTVVPNLSSSAGTITAAITSPPSNYITTITFNGNYLNMGFSDITYARTLLHESIQAEIYRKLLMLSQTLNHELSPNTIELMKNNFEGLYDYFIRYFYSEYVDTFNNDIDLFNKKEKYFEQQMINWEHELMAAHYIQTMGKMLYDFCKGEFTLEQCEKFALSGLQKTSTWDAVRNKDEINLLINQIMNNGSKRCP